MFEDKFRKKFLYISFCNNGLVVMVHELLILTHIFPILFVFFVCELTYWKASNDIRCSDKWGKACYVKKWLCALPWIDKQLIFLIGSNDVVRYDIMGCQ